MSLIPACRFCRAPLRVIFVDLGMSPLANRFLFEGELQKMEPFLTGGHMISSVHADKTTWGELPHKFEAGTAPMAEAVGFGAAIALIVLGIPPILLNTYTGIRGIDPAIIDAAKGMGMTTWQIVTKIQTPLVLPLVAAGVRTTAVQIVATATLATFIGAGGYGDYIVDGINVFNTPELIAGALAVAVVAIIIEVFMGWLQRRVTPAGLRLEEGAEVLKV